MEPRRRGGQARAAPVLTIAGDADPLHLDDAIRLVRDSVNPLLLDVYVNNSTATPDLTVPLSALQRIDVLGGAGGDTLTLDSTHGLINPPDGIHFDGGTGADQLILNGASGQTLPPTNSANQIDLVADGLTQTVVNSNVEQNQINVALALSNPLRAIEDGLLKFSTFTSLLDDPALLAKTIPVIGDSLSRILSGFSSGAGHGQVEPGSSGEDAPTSDESVVQLFRRLVETGPNAFLLSQIGRSVGGLEPLRAALDGLDDVPNNVTFNDTGTSVTFDVHIVKSLDGSGSFDTSAFSGAVQLAGSGQYSARLQLHIVFGVDAQGFYILPSAANDPLLTVDNLNLEGDLNVDGQFGFLGVDLSDARVATSPNLKLSLSVHDPGSGAADGKIRANELLGNSTALATAQWTGDPAADDVTLSGLSRPAPSCRATTRRSTSAMRLSNSPGPISISRITSRSRRPPGQARKSSNS